MTQIPTVVKLLPKGMHGGHLAAHHSKASKQARLMERKVCFISDASNWRGELWTCVQRLTPSPPRQAVGESTYRLSAGVGGNM